MAGVGARAGVSAAEVLALLRETLAEAGLRPDAVTLLATAEAKADEAGLGAAAARLGVPLVAYPARELAAVDVEHPSGAALATVGAAGVAEAAALLAAGPGATLLVPKRRAPRVTVALAGEPDLRHHGDAEIRGSDLTDLAVNVRAGTPPGWLRERLAASLTTLAAYPDGGPAREAVARRHGLPTARVLLTAGAAEAFTLIARAFAPRRPVVVHPQFTEVEAALRDAGHRVDRVLLRAAEGFRLRPGAVPEDADLVVVGNPTNPTSVLHPADGPAGLAALARPGRLLVVDEAFIDAVPGERHSLAGRTDLPGLVVVRSLTKTWGLAGLRVGYVLAGPERIAELARAQPPWPVSTPALTAAVACCEPRALAEAARAAERGAADREVLLERLARFPQITVTTPAAGPFLLVRLAGAAAIRERLRGRGFALRRGDTFPGLGADWLRITVRDPETTDRFAAALAHALTGR
ncbi:threonine-phosphate decarboxylase [Streptomyces sp. PLAI1-29]|uniref:Aminotransferase n=1 Tax=Streptomyces zingiberis TaxID=2053010 RepID=A0ABX1C0F6_9ACTN|nr:threonine-phosphate decarboxylase [Streptomyces zingiberis]